MAHLIQSPQLIRRLSPDCQAIFLTFDDGPNSQTTPEILRILRSFAVQATFFVVGHQAQCHQKILRRISDDGHTIATHSIDHRYHHYFRRSEHLKRWILHSIEHLEVLTGSSFWAFRPPAGVLTPHLLRAAEELDLPLVLWNHRFFDKVRAWSIPRAKPSLDRVARGDIVLLHDQQRKRNQTLFLETLCYYLQCLRESNLKCLPLTPTQLNLEVRRADRREL